MVRLGSRGWVLYRGAACADCQPYPGLRNASWARLWLQQFKSEPAALYEIRRMVVEADTWYPLHKSTDDDTIGWMAKLLADGAWHVHVPALPKTDGAGGSESEEIDLAEIVSSLPALADSPKPPPPKPPDEGSLPADADEAAIAEGMKMASRLGIPFCEECARAALKRSREAAHA
jgi:hypothetical protein